MKSKQNKGKLQLKKQAVSNLSANELSTFKGGNEEAWTTSKNVCTGFLCCYPPIGITTNLCTVTNCTTLTTILL
jgi:hypothetical protein